MVYAITVWSSWYAIGLVTEAATPAAAIMTTSLILGVVFNLVWTVYQPPWLRCAGDAATAAVALAAMSELPRTFPFALPAGGHDPLVRLALVLLVGALLVGLVARLVVLVRLPGS
jgi:hypothetical protein